MAASLLALLAGGLAGCGGQDDYSFEVGALMRPGEDCGSCHGGPDSPYPKAPTWTAAGTVFELPDAENPAHDVTVRIRDATGKLVELQTNHAGNFYTDEPLDLPFNPEIERGGLTVEMPIEGPGRYCNRCHSVLPGSIASGRLVLPPVDP